MMALAVCTVVLVVVVFGVLVLRALNQQGRDVKAGLKIPFATFYFEASDHDKFSPKLLPREPLKPRKESD